MIPWSPPKINMKRGFTMENLREQARAELMSMDEETAQVCMELLLDMGLIRPEVHDEH